MHSKFLPQGSEIGAVGVHYRAWAPVCKTLDLQIFDSGGALLREQPMARTGDGCFHTLDEAGQAGDFYKFRLDGAQSFPDPASRWQPQGVHGPSMVIEPRTYLWYDAGWARPQFRDLVIYELHLGTFTPEGTFRAAIDRLAHVRELGANAIEIMPVCDFAGDRNWGYDGVAWYAPSRAYGHPDDLRALVDAAHQSGLAVILDVVYNHLGPAGNYLAGYIGDYLDEEAKTPWGGAIRYGDPAFKPLRDLVLANPGYWMREFHVDGFRFDATHAIIDPSPVHLLTEMVDCIHDRGGYAIAEDPRNEARLLMPPAEGGHGFDGVWADDFHHTVRVANTHENEAYLGDFAGSLQEVVDTISHGWHYRGQRSPCKQAPRGTECVHLPPEKFVHCIANHDQTGNHPFGTRVNRLVSPEAYRASSALVCLTPGTPLIFMGQEWATHTPFAFFTDHDAELGKLITQGRREEFKDFATFNDPAQLKRIPDPQQRDTFAASKLDWAEPGHQPHAGTLALYRACLRLRRMYAAFRPATRDTWQIEALPCGIAAVRYRDSAGDWLILFDLVGGHSGPLSEYRVCAAANRRKWQTALSSNEAQFGGSGETAVHAGRMYAAFERAELVVLQQVGAM
jgi:maltooligosyltrehalose trehalohydrolase